MAKESKLTVTTVEDSYTYKGEDAERVADALDHAYLSGAFQTIPVSLSSGYTTMFIIQHIVKTDYFSKEETK